MTKSFPVHVTCGRISLVKYFEPDINRLHLRCLEFTTFTGFHSKKGLKLLRGLYLPTAFLALQNKLNKVWKHSFVKIFVPWLALEIMVQINLVCHVIVFKRYNYKCYDIFH